MAAPHPGDARPGIRPRQPSEPALAAGLPATRAARGAVVVGLVALALAVGILSLLLQRHLRAQADAGSELGGISQALADGASWRTAWIGWAAALLFGFSTLRVLRGPPEPPAELRHAEQGVGAIRHAMRREWSWVRGALSVVSVLAALDLGRLIVEATAAAAGSVIARDTLPPLGVEAAGLCAAAATLLLWCSAFRRQLRDLGAL